MNTGMQSMLKSKNGEPVVFNSANIEVSLQELFADITVTQHFSNSSENNIEAVYTFPLPLDAVLLEAEVIIGNRHLQSNVLPKTQAEEKYEDAITDGDLAVMLEKVEPGIFTINVGNLLPNESITIKYNYSMLLRWNNNQLRLHIPTTIAPRYGDTSGMQPHQIPETNIMSENKIGFALEAYGQLQQAQVSSPSHEVAFRNSDDHLNITIPEETTFMDRDIILMFTSDNDNHCGGIIGRDENTTVALASFHLPQPKTLKQQPLHLKLVVDCSGSMSGDSIAQAKEALVRILDSLTPHDYFNLIAFGSHHTMVFENSLPASSESLKQARDFVNNLDANYGGTEIGSALSTAYTSSYSNSDELTPQMLLITDGQVWETEPVIQAALENKHRIFTVGVGSSVAEGFVRELATKTGGQCELVSPNEAMAERIYRHFQRMHTPPVKTIDIKWPTQPMPQRLSGQLNSVFSGDTLHLFEWFSEPPIGNVTLTAELIDGTMLEQTILLDNTHYDQTIDQSSLSRVAAHRQLTEMQESERATELACEYKLVSQWTNTLMVDIRADDEKAEELPELHKVENMLPSGWGGSGLKRKLSRTRAPSQDIQFFDACIKPAPLVVPEPAASSQECVFIPDDWSNLGDDISGEFTEPAVPDSTISPNLFIKYIQIQLDEPNLGIPDSLYRLVEMKLPKVVFDKLVLMVKDNDETEVIKCFIYMLSTTDVGHAFIDKSNRRKITKTAKSNSNFNTICEALSWVARCVENDNWGELESTE